MHTLKICVSRGFAQSASPWHLIRPGALRTLIECGHGDDTVVANRLNSMGWTTLTVIPVPNGIIHDVEMWFVRDDLPVQPDNVVSAERGWSNGTVLWLHTGLPALMQEMQCELIDQFKQLAAAPDKVVIEAASARLWFSSSRHINKDESGEIISSAFHVLCEVLKQPYLELIPLE